MPRIMGTEMEYAISVHKRRADDYPDAITTHQARDVVSSYLPTGIDRMDVGDNGFMSNGARFYIDISGRPEYATPECNTVDDVVVAEIAGERIMQAVIERAVHEGYFHAATVHKRVIGLDGDPTITWGYHENYLADRQRIAPNMNNPEGWLGMLGVHLATRGIYAGAGYVQRISEGGRPMDVPRFMISQKAASVQVDFSTSTTESKPVVNLRDEPHGDKERYFRLHVVSGDPNMSPWATRMKLGTTALVVNMMEDGVTLPETDIKGYLFNLMRMTSSDLTLTDKTVRLYSGKRLRPIDIQRSLQEAAKDHVRSEEEQRIAEDWGTVLDDLEENPRRLQDRVDWIGKLILFERDPASSKIVDAVTVGWDALSPNSIGQKLRRKLYAPHMPDEDRINAAIYVAPSQTRARIRGKAVERIARVLEHERVGFYIDWGAVQVGKSNIVRLDNPYQKTSTQVDKLFTDNDFAI